MPPGNWLSGAGRNPDSLAKEDFAFAEDFPDFGFLRNDGSEADIKGDNLRREDPNAIAPECSAGSFNSSLSLLGRVRVGASPRRI